MSLSLSQNEGLIGFRRLSRPQNKRALDLALAYLRDAFDVCFYCCAVCESPEQLSDMCSRHVRRCDLSSDPRRQAMGELAFRLPCYSDARIARDPVQSLSALAAGSRAQAIEAIN